MAPDAVSPRRDAARRESPAPELTGPSKDFFIALLLLLFLFAVAYNENNRLDERRRIILQAYRRCDALARSAELHVHVLR